MSQEPSGKELAGVLRQLADKIEGMTPERLELTGWSSEWPIRETEPIEDDEGQLWENFERTGEEKYRIEFRIKEPKECQTSN